MTKPFFLCLKDEILVARTALAGNPWERLVGLMPRSGMEASEGLWIKPCYAIHTWGMRFSLDAVFLDSAHRILGILPEVKPWRICRTFTGTRSVLELSSGMAAELGLQVGDLLTFHQEVISD